MKDEELLIKPSLGRLVLSYLVTLFLLLCCSSLFAQQKWFSVEIRQEAKVKLPDSYYVLGSLLLVNNAVRQPDDFGHQNKVNDKSTDGTTVVLSDAPRQVLFGMEEKLYEQGETKEISILDVSQNKQGSFYRQMPLSQPVVDSLCRHYGVEALLVLNHLVVYDYNELFLTDGNMVGNVLEAYSTAQWSLMFPTPKSDGIKRPVAEKTYRFSVADTLYWSAEKRTAEEAVEALPDRQEALLYLAHDLGERTATYIVPQWVKEERYLYQTKDGSLDAGIDFFAHQQWRKAIDEWYSKFSTARDSQTAAYAAADIAVACEMMQDKKEAVKWLDEAEKYLLKMSTADSRQQIVNLRYYKRKLMF